VRKKEEFSEMTATKLQPRGYDYILDNLREHKEKVDRAIRALEALRESAIPAAVVLDNGAESSRNSSDIYGGMHFLEAVRKLFAKTRGALTTSQITEALLGGGFSSESENPKKVIAAQLHRYADNGESGIVKAARGLWALDEAALRKSS
jgi:hypothetical protein